MGVLAVYGVPDAATFIYYGLHNLQHRGQEGGGIITFDAEGKSHRHRGQGLLSEVFTNGEIRKLPGTLGLGSVKYANASKGGLDNVEPLFFHHCSGDFAVAADGNAVPDQRSLAENDAICIKESGRLCGFRRKNPDSRSYRRTLACRTLRIVQHNHYADSSCKGTEPV